MTAPSTESRPGLLRRCGGPTTELARWAKRRGLYPYFLPVEEATATEVRIQGEWKVMLGSNNYLGLTHDPRVSAAAREAMGRYGTGATGSRLLTGNIDLLDDMEERFAELWGKEAALVFSTGYQTNLGVVSGLLGRGDHVFLDRRSHASIVDGALLSRGTIHRFGHRDHEDLDRLLEGASPDAGTLVVTDGVFSMEGHLAPLPELVAAARRHGAALMVDEAHALGVLGTSGAGSVEHFGLQGEVDLIMATFSKSLGSMGGVVAGPAPVLEHLEHNARPFMFTAALPPASVAGVLAALDIMLGEPERRARLWERSSRLRDGLRSLGFCLRGGDTPIIPVEIGDVEATCRFWKALFDGGVFVHPVVPPAVPPNSCLLRVSLTAAHTEAQIDRVLEVFRKARDSRRAAGSPTQNVGGEP